jgi:hypothetical protein
LGFPVLTNPIFNTMGYVRSYRRKDGTYVQGHYRGGGARGSWTPNTNEEPKGDPVVTIVVLIIVFFIYKACS